jgi:hypothetical protein
MFKNSCGEKGKKDSDLRIFALEKNESHFMEKRQLFSIFPFFIFLF